MTPASHFFCLFVFVVFVMGALLSYNRSAVLSCFVVVHCSRDDGFGFQIRCHYHLLSDKGLSGLEKQVSGLRRF